MTHAVGGFAVECSSWDGGFDIEAFGADDLEISGVGLGIWVGPFLSFGAPEEDFVSLVETDEVGGVGHDMEVSGFSGCMLFVGGHCCFGIEEGIISIQVFRDDGSGFGVIDVAVHGSSLPLMMLLHRYGYGWEIFSV